MLLTNGGGKHDSERAADLSEKLGVPFTADNVVQSHSPFRRLVDHEQNPYRDKTIFVTGQDAAKCREIAES
jgi:ribonucleotide monophosphatase NagD (HAD superfamily)